MTPTVMDDLGFSSNGLDCPAGLEDINFSTSFQCLSCQKLHLDLTALKHKISEYEKVIKPLKESALKTDKILKKFKSTNETLNVQKSALQKLEKQNERLKNELLISQSQLKQHLSQDSSPVTPEQHEALILETKSQKYALDQCNTKISNLETEIMQYKDMEKKCKLVENQLKDTLKKQPKPKSDSFYEEQIKSLKEENTKLKEANRRLNNVKDSSIEKAAEKKNKEVMKELADMKSVHTRMESMMKEVLERTAGNYTSAATLNTDVSNRPTGKFKHPSSSFKTPEKRKNKTRPVNRSNDHSSNSSTLDKPSQSKKRGRPVGYSPKHGKVIKKGSNLLDSETESDDDMDLVNELESSLNASVETSQRDDTIVCDPLTPSRRKEICSHYSLFEQPSLSAVHSSSNISIPTPPEPLKTRNLPRIFNVNDIFSFVIPLSKLSPLNSEEESQGEDTLQEERLTIIKSEVIQPSLNSSSIIKPPEVNTEVSTVYSKPDQIISLTTQVTDKIDPLLMNKDLLTSIKTRSESPEDLLITDTLSLLPTAHVEPVRRSSTNNLSVLLADVEPVSPCSSTNILPVLPAEIEPVRPCSSKNILSVLPADVKPVKPCSSTNILSVLPAKVEPVRPCSSTNVLPVLPAKVESVRPCSSTNILSVIPAEVEPVRPCSSINIVSVIPEDLEPELEPCSPTNKLSETMSVAEVVCVANEALNTPIKVDPSTTSNEAPNDPIQLCTAPVKIYPSSLNSSTHSIHETPEKEIMLFSPIMIKNEKMKKSEATPKMTLTIKTSQNQSVLSTLGNILAENVPMIPDIPGSDTNPVVIEENLADDTNSVITCENDSQNTNPVIVYVNDEPNSVVTKDIVEECPIKKSTDKTHGKKSGLPITAVKIKQDAINSIEEIPVSHTFQSVKSPKPIVLEDQSSSACSSTSNSTESITYSESAKRPVSDIVTDKVKVDKTESSYSCELVDIDVKTPFELKPQVESCSACENINKNSSIISQSDRISELDSLNSRDLSEKYYSQVSKSKDFPQTFSLEKSINSTEVISGDSMLCAFEIDVVSPFKSTASKSKVKQLDRLSKKLSTSLSIETRKPRGRPKGSKKSVSKSESKKPSATKKTRGRPSISQTEDKTETPMRKTRLSSRQLPLTKQTNLNTKCLRNRKVSLSVSPEKSTKTSKTRKISQSKTAASLKITEKVQSDIPSDIENLINNKLQISVESVKSSESNVKQLNDDAELITMMNTKPGESMPKSANTVCTESLPILDNDTIIEVLREKRNSETTDEDKLELEICSTDVEDDAVDTVERDTLPLKEANSVLSTPKPLPKVASKVIWEFALKDNDICKSSSPKIPKMLSNKNKKAFVTAFRAQSDDLLKTPAKPLEVGNSENAADYKLQTTLQDLTMNVKNIDDVDKELDQSLRIADCTANLDIEMSEGDLAIDFGEAQHINMPPVSIETSLQPGLNLSTISTSSCTSTILRKHEIDISPDQVCRKRKRTKPPQPSLDKIFDLFIPNNKIVIHPLENNNNQQIAMSDGKGLKQGTGQQETTGSVNLQLSNTVSITSAVDDQPLDKGTYADMSHISYNSNRRGLALVDLFRKQLNTNNPNIPYLVKTIVQNCMHNFDPFLKIIRNELHCRESLPQDAIKPPIDVLVHLFLDIINRLDESGEYYFSKSHFIPELLTRIFWNLKQMTHTYKGLFMDLCNFGVMLSVATNEFTAFRSFLINLILRNGTHYFVKKMVTECLNNYNPLSILGKEHLGYDEEGQLATIDCVYLAGLEFYLRYSCKEYSGGDNLTYIHQYTVEQHLIDSALSAVVVKEEAQEERKYLNQQGVICLKLMLRAQGWPWLTSTLLLKIFDTMSKSTAFGICRLIELIVSLVTSEISFYRADLGLIKDSLIPTLHGLLLTAPDPSIQLALARALLDLAPLDAEAITTLLRSWFSTLSPKISTARDFEELRSNIGKVKLVFTRQYSGEPNFNNKFNRRTLNESFLRPSAKLNFSIAS